MPDAADTPLFAGRPLRRRAASDDPQLLGADLHPVLGRLYSARGVRNSADLALSLDRLLPVGTLEGVEPAVELLIAHRGGRVLVVGDFDADGATSTALLLRALRAWGFAQVDFLVPNRFEFGYGLTPEIVELAAKNGAPTLLVTVDNGISSHAGVALARSLGIAVLITDHHLPAATLPDADVIVNPNVPGSRFGSRALAGVGVAFYVMAALKRKLDALGLVDAKAPPVAEFLDLVALGTVADLVPLDLNNRVLVAQGLKRIRAGRCAAGIRALLEVAERDREQLTATDLGFIVAPRLNAAGRLDDMSIGIRCLVTDNLAEARATAARLQQLNQERRSIESEMQALALTAVKGIDLPSRSKRHGLCLFDAGWHQGVVGLVASRVKDRVRRPVIAFARATDATSGGSLRGSARSVTGVHVRDVLDAIATREPDLIAKFGGHAMAAGLTLEERWLDRFSQAFDAECALWMARAGGEDAIETDGELPAHDIALSTAQLLRDAGPWGQGFPEPSFDGVFAIKSSRIVGDKHVKLWVQHPDDNASFDAIAFNYIDGEQRRAAPSGNVRLVYRLDINEYRGERKLQLLVDHLQAVS
ncbi:MAG: single-stranded-DNA-specific exonuclease RecJ [Steroidobacteraceae bacterium]